MENKLSGIMLTAAALAGYAVITKADKYELVVASTPTEKNLVKREGGFETYIVNLKAIAEDKLEQLSQLFNGRNEVPIEEAQGLFMTANIINREGVRLPIKGEKVTCIVDWVNGKDFAETAQQVLRVSAPPLVKQSVTPAKLDVTKFFKAEEPAITHEKKEESVLV